MKKLLFATIMLVAFATSSCAPLSLAGKVKKVEIGMTKQEVVSALGDKYEVQGAVSTPEGTLETLLFWDMNNRAYTFNFLNGMLVEWYEKSSPPAGVVIPMPPNEVPHNVAPPQPQRPNGNHRPNSSGGGYTKDSWTVFYQGKEVKDASASSFKHIGDSYGKDNWTVFYRGAKVGDASASSFQSLGGGYAKDNWTVFYRGTVVKDASASSFQYLEDGYAKDNWTEFYRGKETR